MNDGFVVTSEKMQQACLAFFSDFLTGCDGSKVESDGRKRKILSLVKTTFYGPFSSVSVLNEGIVWVDNNPERIKYII